MADTPDTAQPKPTVEYAHFENLVRQRLYRLLLAEAERRIDRVERRDAIFPDEMTLKAHELLLAAQQWKDPTPEGGGGAAA
jgi:hypothetical protein